MNAVILEDETLIAKELQHKIAKVAPDVNIITRLDSIEAAKQWLAENPHPDLFFMDIQLGDGMSFELFNLFSIKAPIIFTTAYDEYAIQAFKVNGIDYLLKPIDIEELSKAIDKCRALIKSQPNYPQDIETLMQMLSGTKNTPRYKEKFIASFRKQWILIDTKDIALFIRENLNYLFTFGGEKHILDFSTLEEIETLLDPNLYYRANRQSIVHINAIKGVKPLDNATLQVYLKPPLEKMDISVGRAKAPVFKKWFDR